MGIEVEDAARTLRFLVLDLRDQSSQSVVLRLHSLIDARVDAFVIRRTPLAQMLVQLVARVFKHLSSLQQLQPPIAKFHNIHLGPAPGRVGLTGVNLHHRALELATQLRAELALVVHSTNAPQSLVGAAVG